MKIDLQNMISIVILLIGLGTTYGLLTERVAKLEAKMNNAEQLIPAVRELERSVSALTATLKERENK